MSKAIKKTFVVAVPPRRVWQAFVDGNERAKWYSPRFEIDPQVGGKTVWQIGDFPGVEGEVLEIDEPRLLRTSEEASLLPGATEVTVTLEEADSGTRVTITHSGFGDGAEWGDHFEGHSLGWQQSIDDLILYLERGVVADRFFTMWRTSLGMATAAIHGGLEVVSVEAGGYAAQTGIAAGDVLLRIAGVPIYSRNDLWCIQFSHSSGEQLIAEYARGSERLSGSGVLQALSG